MKSTKRNMAIGIGFVAAAGIAGSAFAAAITTVGSNAGQGTSVTAGYNATDIGFTSNVATTNSSAANVTGITFKFYVGVNNTTTAADAGHTVLARVGTGQWATCSITASPTRSCTLGSAVAASSVNSVEIVAFKN